MRRKHIQFLSSIAIVAILLFVFEVQAPTNFQVKWAMDLSAAGVSACKLFAEQCGPFW